MANIRPSKQTRQGSLLRERTPERFIRLFQIKTSAREVINRVLNSSNLVIDEFFDKAGIAKVIGIKPPLEGRTEECD